MKTLLNGLDHVLPQGKVTLGSRQPEAMPYFRHYVNADAQPGWRRIRLSCHVQSLAPEAHDFEVLAIDASGNQTINGPAPRAGPPQTAGA